MNINEFANHIKNNYEYYVSVENNIITVEAEEEYLACDFEEISADVSFMSNMDCERNGLSLKIWEV